MQHQTNVSYKNGLKDLAIDLSDLRYDALEEFLHLLSEKIAKDATADTGRGRSKLAASLQATARALDEAVKCIREAWEISKPYMKEDGSC